MKLREILEKLQTLTDEQLDQNAVIYFENRCGWINQLKTEQEYKDEYNEEAEAHNRSEGFDKWEVLGPDDPIMEFTDKFNPQHVWFFGYD